MTRPNQPDRNMEDDPLKDELQKVFNAGSGRTNYTMDIAGDLGTSVRAPTLTNLPNTLVVSAHGGRNSGFSPDKSATNELAKIVRQKIDKGGELTLEDIASSMGSATNDIKRAIISACFAAGYNYDRVKSLFPKLEQLVAPSTELPSSAVYDRYLTRKVSPPMSYTESLRGKMSPLFNITPTQTNSITKTSDYLPPGQRKMVEVPLSVLEAERDKSLPKLPQSFKPYSGKPGIPSSIFKRDLQSALDWQRDALSRATNNAEIDLIAAEAKRRIQAVGE